MRFIVKLLVNAAAVWVAAELIDGIRLEEGFVTILVVALVFGLLNTFLRPIVQLLSLPALLVTLGLFSLIINTAMLALTAWMLDTLSIDGFWSAFLGALVISIVSVVLGKVLNED
jgi:putative membrane protein